MQRDNELANYMKRMYDVFTTGNVGIVDDLVSDDEGVVGIGTDPREWWVGDAFHQALKAQSPEMQAAGLRIVPGELVAYREGSVGWIADQPIMKSPDGGELPMRMTAVCHQEAGAWKIVQAHLSIGVPNEQALGEELTV